MLLSSSVCMQCFVLVHHQLSVRNTQPPSFFLGVGQVKQARKRQTRELGGGREMRVRPSLSARWVLCLQLLPISSFRPRPFLALTHTMPESIITSQLEAAGARSRLSRPTTITTCPSLSSDDHARLRLRDGARVHPPRRRRVPALLARDHHVPLGRRPAARYPPVKHTGTSMNGYF
jgi:hypothetical protein